MLRRTTGGRALLRQLVVVPQLGVADKVLAVPPPGGPGSAQGVPLAVVAVVDHDVTPQRHLRPEHELEQHLVPELKNNNTHTVTQGASTHWSNTWSQN